MKKTLKSTAIINTKKLVLTVTNRKTVNITNPYSNTKLKMAILLFCFKKSNTLAVCYFIVSTKYHIHEK
jgi:hypothetical protein